MTRGGRIEAAGWEATRRRAAAVLRLEFSTVICAVLCAVCGVTRSGAARQWARASLHSRLLLPHVGSASARLLPRSFVFTRLFSNVYASLTTVVALSPIGEGGRHYGHVTVTAGHGRVGRLCNRRAH